MSKIANVPGRAGGNQQARQFNKVGMSSPGIAAGATAQTSKIGIHTTDPSRATAPAPTNSLGTSERTTQIDTFVTSVPTDGESPETLYSGDRVWAQVTLTLETAGPVAVGNSQNLFPVIGGPGQLLETGVPLKFFIAKGQRLYIAATAANRVRRTIEPLPWLEAIQATLLAIVNK